MSCGLQERVDGIDRQMGRIDRQMGSILEQQAGVVVEKLLGDGYARAMMAQSLQDLTQLLPDEAVYRNPNQKEVSMRCLLHVTFAMNYVILTCDGICRSSPHGWSTLGKSAVS